MDYYKSDRGGVGVTALRTIVFSSSDEVLFLAFQNFFSQSEFFISSPPQGTFVMIRL